MIERYKTLGAMLSLEQFTVPELSRASGVKSSTVRTVVSRSGDLIEEIGREKTGKRGGSYIRYRLRSGAGEQLAGQLRELESIGQTATETTNDSASLPAALIAAEDILLEQLPEASDPDRRASLMRTAHTASEDGRRGVERSEAPHPDGAAHLRVIEFLLRLAEIESEETSSLGRIALVAAVELYEDLRRLIDELPELEDESLVSDLVRRVAGSPVNDLVHWSFAPPYYVVLDGEDEGQLTPQVAEVLKENSPDSVVAVHDWDSVVLSELAATHHDRPQTVVVTVNSARHSWREVLDHVRGMSEDLEHLDDFLVVADLYDSELSNAVYSRHGRYVAAEQMSREALAGALVPEAPKMPIGLRIRNKAETP